MSKTNFNNYDKAHVDESCRITLSDTDFFSLRSCPSRYMWSPYDIHFQNQGLCWRKELRFPGNICVKVIIFPTHKLYSLFNTISLKHNTLNWYFQCLLNLYLSLFVIIIYRKDESYKVTVHLLVASLSLQICKGGQILTENMSVNIQYILVKFDPIPQRLTCLIDFFFSKEGNSKAKKKILKGPLQHFCQQRKVRESLVTEVLWYFPLEGVHCSQGEILGQQHYSRVYQPMGWKDENAGLPLPKECG